MRIEVDVPDTIIKELMKVSNVKTKDEAIITAIKLYISYRKRRKLITLIGNYEYGSTLSQLEKMREDD